MRLWSVVVSQPQKPGASPQVRSSRAASAAPCRSLPSRGRSWLDSTVISGPSSPRRRPGPRNTAARGFPLPCSWVPAFAGMTMPASFQSLQVRDDVVQLVGVEADIGHVVARLDALRVGDPGMQGADAV